MALPQLVPKNMNDANKQERIQSVLRQEDDSNAVKMDIAALVGSISTLQEELVQARATLAKRRADVRASSTTVAQLKAELDRRQSDGKEHNANRSELHALESKVTSALDYQTSLSDSIALLRSQKMHLLNSNKALQDEIALLRNTIKQGDEVRNDLGYELAEFLYDLTQITNKYSFPEQELSTIRTKREESEKALTELSAKVKSLHTHRNSIVLQVLAQEPGWKERYQVLVNSGTDPLKLPPNLVSLLLPIEGNNNPNAGVLFSNDNVLSGATRNRIIQQIVNSNIEVKTDYDIVFAFLLSHRLFIDSRQLLQAMIAYYSNIDGNTLSLSLRSHICDVIRLWLEAFPEDFIDNEDLNALVHFFAFCAASSEHKEAICKTLSGEDFMDKKKSVRSKPVDVPTSLSFPFNIFALSPSDLARQIALVDMELFTMILPSEFVALELSPPNQYDSAPHISAFIAQADLIAQRFTDVILNERPTNRCEAIRHIFFTSHECFRIGDFSAVFSLFAALNSPKVAENKELMELFFAKYLTKEHDSLYLQLYDFVSPQPRSQPNQTQIPKPNPTIPYPLYREAWNVAKPPAIPYFPVLIADLRLLLSGSKTLIEKAPASRGNEQYVNISKCLQLSDFVQKVQSFQKAYPYKKALNDVRSWLYSTETD